MQAESNGVAFRPSGVFWLWVLPAVALTWAVHELAHYQMGRWLGYEMWLSMNQAGSVDGKYATQAHGIMITMAGPLVTYGQAALALGWVLQRKSALAYVFLYVACFMRVVAFGVSFMNPNDEARASLDLGLPMWVLPALAVALLLGMTILGSRALKVGWRTNVLLYLLASLLVSAIVLGDPLVGRILGA